jgi:polyketide-type polyunsaturated fatty acid synthase PfaA
MSRPPIAIVGLAGTFAGSRNLGEYWGNILNEVDGITDVPATHWSVEDYYDPDPKAQDKTYCRRGGFIPGADFNPIEFGLPPNILELTDVAQLLSLVIARQALADAGYGAANRHAETTGVVLGVSALGQITPLVSRLQYPIWKRVLRNSGMSEADSDAIIGTIKQAYIDWREDAFPGYLSNVVAGRIANRLDLRGINCSIDAACASSIASLQMAAHELSARTCDVVLAGGVDLNNSVSGFLSFSKTPAFTAHDRMRPFDADSDGMLIGEGIGMLVLRRLDDAERDGDRIYAVVRGIGASSDGKFKSIYAPRMEGQELALRRAYQEAGCEPSSVGLIEAHGTGTPTGDPTELAALRRVFRDESGRGRHIALGSVKSQIGHTKVASGAASLIKTAMALHDKILPPTINVGTPHPALEEDGTPFYLNTHARPWFSSERRRAAVSSFGFGGTNFHVVLEEHTRSKPETSRKQLAPFAVFLQAPDTDALRSSCREVLAALTSDRGDHAWRSLVESSKREDIAAGNARVGFVAASRGEAASLIESAIQSLDANPASIGPPGRVHYRQRGFDTRGGLVVLFPGQGSQYLEMGSSLCQSFPVVQQAYEDMDAVLSGMDRAPISSVVFPPPVFEARVREEQNDRLRATQNAQAAVGAFNRALYMLLQSCGLSPDYVAGHSLGELTALWAGGAIGDRDYHALLAARGQAMAVAPDSTADAGTLLALKGDADMLTQFIAGHRGVTVANRNSRSQLVVAGSKSDLEMLKSELAALGNSATFLPVSGAFHSPFVAHAQAPFARALEGVAFSTPRIPTYANGSGRPYPGAADAIRQQLAGHIVNPVNFRGEIEAIHAAGGRIFVECGPGNALTGLVGDILSGQPHLAIALNPAKSGDSDRLLREAYVQLRVAGVPLTDLDPHQPLPEARTSAPGTVRLTGAPYVSESTKTAFQSALERAPKIMSDIQQKNVIEQTVTLTGDTSSHAHYRYLENMSEHSSRYFELMQRLYALVSNPGCPPATLELFERTMGHFHEQQLVAQQVHTQYLKNQVEYSQRITPGSFESGPELPSITAYARPQMTLPPAPRPPVTAAPLAAPSVAVMEPIVTAPAMNGTTHAAAAVASRVAVAAPPSGAEDIAAILLEVISDKTGYPLETLDASMDLDSDLGIDSLKRVEIMAALEGRLFSSLAGINFETFAELRTVSQIATYLATVGSATPVH